MRVFLVLCLFLTAYAPAAQAQFCKFFRLPKVTTVSPRTLSYVERRALVSNYNIKVDQVLALNRLNLPAVRLPMLKTAVTSYYKAVALRFPNVAVKSMNEAKNTMEDMVLSLPASLKTENVFIEKIPGIEKPTEVYLSAMFADSWGNWLESGIGLQPPAEMAASKADIKTAQALYKDLSENFTRQYAALPAEQKDFRAQLTRVMNSVQEQTGWSNEVIEGLEQYFLGVMRPFLAKQDNLSAVEFLQAYDVLAVAAELPVRNLHRLQKGAATSVEFLIPESIQRVRRELVEGFIPAKGSARDKRLQKWYEGLFSHPNF